jgi:hypothetical protein
LLWVPKGSTLGPLFNIFINLSAWINHPKFLLFADDLETHHNIKYVEKCKALKANTVSVQQQCGENCMQLNTLKTKIIFFTCKTNSTYFNYYVHNVLILRSDCIKDLGVTLNSKPNFHCHVDSVYPQALTALQLIHFITHFTPSQSSLILYIALFQSKLSMPLSYGIILHWLPPPPKKKAENIQIKFANCVTFFSVILNTSFQMTTSRCSISY